MDGSTVDEAQVAADIWEASKPHAPTKLLAWLYRNNLPFPETREPAVAPGLQDVLALGLTVERYGHYYFRFRCPKCRTSVFQPATQLGISDITYFAQVHDCAGRAARNAESVFPESLGD